MVPPWPSPVQRDESPIAVIVICASAAAVMIIVIVLIFIIGVMDVDRDTAIAGAADALTDRRRIATGPDD